MSGPAPVEWRVVARSGPRPWRWRPVATIVPASWSDALLFRDGRARPIPCQFESDDAGDRLWWIIDRLAVGSEFRGRAVTGVRKRRSRPRVTLQPSATGWIVRTRGVRVAELFCPAQGFPTLRLYDGERRVATVTHRSSAPGTIAAPPRRQSRPPIVTQGAVFGRLCADYRYLSPHGEALWEETYSYRFFDGPEAIAIVDLDVAWNAIAGPIRLAGAGDPEPLLALEVDRPESQRVLASAGWIGEEEIAGRTAPWVAWIHGDHGVMVAAASEGLGAAPRWRFGADGLAMATPAWGPALAPEGSRWTPIGGSIQRKFRIIRYRSKFPYRFAGRRFLEFDVAPMVATIEPGREW